MHNEALNVSATLAFRVLTHWAAQALAIGVPFALAACADSPASERLPAAPSQPLPDGVEEIVYRGYPVRAERYGQQLVIEGDILVTETDLRVRRGGAGTPSQDKGGSRTGSQQNHLFKWRNGVIPYVFADDIPEGINPLNGYRERDATREAMATWTARNPAIRFVPWTGQADYVSIQRSGMCRASAGMVGGKALVELGIDCARHSIIDHELGHVLGLEHEHQRSDRDLSITMLWGNIIGCPSSATAWEHCSQRSACVPDPLDCGCTAQQVADDMCNARVGSFAAVRSAGIGPFDYQSIMIYTPISGSSKCRNAAGQVSLTCPTGFARMPVYQAPPGIVIAPSPLPTEKDLASIDVMYPALRVHASGFARTGARPMCTLDGRSEDIATYFTLAGLPATAGSNLVDTNALAPGTYAVTCSAKSLFWLEGYNYPNTTRTFSAAQFNATPPELVESFSDSRQVTLLEPGLIPVLL